MTRVVIAALAATCIALTPADRAVAGIADTPLPTLNGEAALHVYSILGIVKDVGGMQTLVSCTSTASAAVSVGIQVFKANGDLSLSAGVVVLAPGETKTIAVAPLAAFPADFVLAETAEVIANGSARILATSKKIVCHALIADAAGVPPTSILPLRVIAKTKQKGD